MVCGILATLLGLNPAFFLGALPLGVVALVLGIVAYKQGKNAGTPTGTATAGIVLGSTGLAFSVAMWIVCHMLVSGAKNAVEKGFAEPLKKMVAEAEKQTKAERETGIPLDRAHAIVVTAAKLSSDLQDNEAASSRRYRGKTLEVTGEIETVSQHFGNDKYLDIELVGDVSCLLVTSENARALELKQGRKVTVIGVFESVLGADLKGCVIK